jgi:hypothetical protein
MATLGAPNPSAASAPPVSSLPPLMSSTLATVAAGPGTKRARGEGDGGDDRWWRLGWRPPVSTGSASRAATLDERRQLLLQGLRQWMVVAVVGSCARRDPSTASAGGTRKGAAICGARMVWLWRPPSTESSFVIVGQRMAAWGHVRLLRV